MIPQRRDLNPRAYSSRTAFRSTESQSRLLINALPEADFRYRSRAVARLGSESATYVFGLFPLHLAKVLEAWIAPERIEGGIQPQKGGRERNS